MNFTIDTDNKVITVHNMVKLEELNEELKKVIREEELVEYYIKFEPDYKIKFPETGEIPDAGSPYLYYSSLQ